MIPTVGFLSRATSAWANAVADGLNSRYVGVYADATARDADIDTPTEGMLAWLTTPNRMTRYNGSIWVVVGWDARIGCSARGSTNVSANSGVATPAPLDVEDYDSDSFHSTISNNSRITIPAGLAGEYDLCAHARCGTTSLGTNAFLGIRKNGTTMLVRVSVPGQAFASGAPVRTVVLAAGDYVELVGYQGTGATIADTIATSAAGALDPASPILEVTYRGPG